MGLIIKIVCGLFLLFIFGMILNGYIKTEHPEWLKTNYEIGEQECIEQCNRFDMEESYFNWDMFSGRECWCLDNETKRPTQIY